MIAIGDLKKQLLAVFREGLRDPAVTLPLAPMSVKKRRGR